MKTIGIIISCLVAIPFIASNIIMAKNLSTPFNPLVYFGWFLNFTMSCGVAVYYYNTFYRWFKSNIKQ